MLTLALDTTTKSGSAALARDGVVIDEAAGDADRPPAARLPLELRELLERHGLVIADVDLFAVATGPGSFTGLRIGIATMQGLAFAARKPLVGISGLEALADTAGQRSGLVATWVDAWRGEVYAALFEEGRERAAPTVDEPGAILAAMPPSSILFIGDGARTYRDAIAARRPDAAFGEPIAPLIAGSVARLATRAARGGAHPPPHAIRPLYVRRPDAELARSRARGLTPQMP